MLPEASEMEFSVYYDVVANARAFAEQLMVNGFECLTGGTYPYNTYRFNK